jgi:ferredoxin
VTTIKVNRETCQGYGNCVMAFPEAFDLDDDGFVVLKRDTADDSEADPLRRAVYDCPTDSIIIADASPAER